MQIKFFRLKMDAKIDTESDDPLNAISDENTLHSMLEESEDFDLRRRIRSRLRQLKKAKPGGDEPDSSSSSSSRNKTTAPGCIKASQQQKVVRPRETSMASVTSSPASSSSSRREDSPAGRTTTWKPTRATAPTSFVPKTAESKSEIPAVSLRAVVTSSKPSKLTENPKAEFLGGVSLRKVDAPSVKISINDTSAASVRPTARKDMNPKMARVHFKEIDAATASLTVGQDGEESGVVVRSRSPSPNRMRQAMMDWCHYRTSGYKNVDISDFSGSWSDGLAFCALAHSFFPDAFSFDELDPTDVRGNFQLAFDTLEQQGEVYPLLEADDMVTAGSNPDWKCIYTYVNSIYAQLSAPSKPKEPGEQPQREEDNNQGNSAGCTETEIE
jgi:hypothetical protein